MDEIKLPPNVGVHAGQPTFTVEQVQAIILADRAARPTADQQVAGSVELTPVINWLEGGCDPINAARELRLLQKKWDSRAQPVAAGELPKLPKPNRLSGPNLDSLHALYTADQMRVYGQQCADSRLPATSTDKLAQIDLDDDIIILQKANEFLSLPAEEGVWSGDIEGIIQFAYFFKAYGLADSRPVAAGELPPLPDAAHYGPPGTGSYFDSYTADQMRAYGQQCIDAQMILGAPTAFNLMLHEHLRAGYAEGYSDAQQCATTAPWLTLAHTICADAGIPPGRIDDRLAALRDVLDSRPAGGATDRNAVLEEAAALCDEICGCCWDSARDAAESLAEEIRALKSQPAATLAASVAQPEAEPVALAYLTLGGVDSSGEFEDNDIEPDNKAIEALQQQLVTYSKNIDGCTIALFASPVAAAVPDVASLTRHDPTVVPYYHSYSVRMYPRPDGEWVKFADVQGMLAAAPTTGEG